ncbi:putative Zn-dependent protease-like protein [Hyella patelloides LEGE 07179]|uniref:Putative Zn-dependent protease-like protein n=1 Tax=Hyella patelloides LEGE 07179 TaxID=945734 RepID=A0A563VV90_9CYAN|nr:TldD/PmbA family protein [Hyella patelloides]VEP15378.1 putative Zn-dependent protease-like protein [Hyella patelloides LEGE 07179]
MNKHLAKVIDLAKQKGIEAEVYYLSSQDTPIEFANNRLKSLQTKAVEGIALRVIKDGRLGFASASDLSRLEELVDAAVATSEIGDPVEFDFAKDVQLTEPDSNYQLPSTNKLVEIGEKAIAKVHQYNGEILVDVGFDKGSSQVQLATTSGTFAQQSDKTVSASVSGNLVQGEDFLQAYAYQVTRDEEPDYEQIIQDLIAKYQKAEQSATIASGNYPVLFTPFAAAFTLGGLFKTILSGQAIVQKSSPLVDKVGEKVFDNRFTLTEEPAFGASACSFDDEGTPTSKKTLIDNGVVKQFYWNRLWASRGGTTSSGNGFRGGLSRPGTSLVNLCMTPGSTSLEELIAGMEEGIIVDQVLGAGQSNQLAGEFSVNLDLGYKVEKGEIVGRVKNTMVAGNIFDAFNNLVDFSDRSQWVGSSSHLPYILFSQLGVASRN